MKKYGRNRGITLIALVVTVIVLLILAGISISMLTGQNGILNRAGEAKEQTEVASDFEYLRQKIAEIMSKYYASSSNSNENQYILNELNKENNIKADIPTETIEYNGKKYDLNQITGTTSEQKAIEAQNIKLKKITNAIATNEEDISLFKTGKIRAIIQEEENETLKAIIPVGFYYVTGAPSTGLVISDIEGDDENNTKGGNQFVWIPCKGNGAVIYEKSENKEEKYGIATSWNEYSKYSYSYTEYKDWTDYGGNLDSVKKYGGFYVARFEAGVPNEASFYAEQDGTTYVRGSKNTSEYKPVSKKNNQVWNYVYQTTAKELGRKMYENNEFVESQLIDSYAWDTITDWMKSDVENIGIDGTGYGNYKDSGLKATNALYAFFVYDNGWNFPSVYNKGNITTKGYTELATGVNVTEDSPVKNKIKNIYDMAGNAWEWTTEVGNHGNEEILLTEEQATNGKYGVVRGGSFYNESNTHPVSRRDGDLSALNYMSFNIGFRVVLYIK